MVSIPSPVDDSGGDSISTTSTLAGAQRGHILKGHQHVHSRVGDDPRVEQTSYQGDKVAATLSKPIGKLAVPVNEVKGAAVLPPSPDSGSDDTGHEDDTLYVDRMSEPSPTHGTPSAAGTPASTHMVDIVDLVYAVPGMYRLLDLVSDKSSNGLVDKIVIDQECLGRFINKLHVGAYASMTRIDFKSLDEALVKPIGLYGSQSELSEFLEGIGAVDPQTAVLLRESRDAPMSSSTPRLRSGIYALQMPRSELTYVIYWPQDATWNDDAESAIQRNRITFMRYLTKITQQTIALISPEHACKLVFGHDEASENSGPEMLDEDRLFSFKVEATKEQKEDIEMQDGFSYPHPSLQTSVTSSESNTPSEILCPRLVGGDTAVGFIRAVHIKPIQESQRFKDTRNATQLRHFIENFKFRLSPSLSPEAVKILLEHGLDRRCPVESQALRASLASAEKIESEGVRTARFEISKKVADSEAVLSNAVKKALTDAIMKRFSLQWDRDDSDNSTGLLNHVLKLYPEAGGIVRDASNASEFQSIADDGYTRQKERIMIVTDVLEHLSDKDKTDKNHWRQLIDRFMIGESVNEFRTGRGSTSSWSRWGWSKDSSGLDARTKSARNSAQAMRDADFLSNLDHLVIKEPLLAEAATGVSRAAEEYLLAMIQRTTERVTKKILGIQQERSCDRITQEMQQNRREADRASHATFLASACNIMLSCGSTSPSEPAIYIIENISSGGDQNYYFNQSRYESRYTISGTKETEKPSRVVYKMHVLELTEGDRHRLLENPRHNPDPRVPPHAISSFELPLESRIVHMQLLEQGRILLIYDDGHGSIWIYLESVDAIGAALRRPEVCCKKLRKDRMGDQVLFTYNETRRMLAVLANSESKLKIHLYIFDERYTDLRGYGMPISLSAWYGDDPPTITHFIHAGGTTEELVLVDSDSRVRVYSLVTQQFRPTSVTLPEPTSAIVPSPDASCLFSVALVGGTTILRAYHWSNFGDTDGIVMYLDPGVAVDAWVLTSFSARTSVHCVGIDLRNVRLMSMRLFITCKITELSIQEQGVNRNAAPAGSLARTAHNCLIECHADAWTRFPVVPAVKRRTIVTSKGMRPPALLFVTDSNFAAYGPFWTQLITQFEQRTRKPTGSELSDIVVAALEPSLLGRYIPSEISTFLAGQWIVDILCLIPIHIAVARDNRFIPLKDGVFSPEQERSLLGAKVEEIINSISFGWYESIFQSYMATKPVKVVSSMGEQSVGKSFALNHFVDTSFAGSAMRTTEGVWMSVNPTDDTLIVALDFEGVHSIERSAQEDTLLVLFNTAISNLVLFRNNFALSRDLTNLFQSFQSSSSVLDPAANPDLFSSTLTIIIKDVVDSDKREITKEFRLKFQQIVQREQESNFISKLHRGSIHIIPWPVIESSNFYTTFNMLKRCLDKEKVSHPQAGIFLLTMKTLMAKLKANDWGSISQNLASHRAQLLSDILPIAVIHGVAEIEPEREPLKNLDDAMPIQLQDTVAVFNISQGKEGESDRLLSNLRQLWSLYSARITSDEEQWLSGLEKHLEELVVQRLNVVDTWLNLNTSRFPDTNADIGSLRRAFAQMSNDIRSSIQLCKLKCTECYRTCLFVRKHDGSHNCTTDHKCSHLCEFEVHGANDVNCGLPANHPGSHICDVAEHLCGKPCKLLGKEGCLSNCVKEANHEHKGDAGHFCQAKLHECGEPCDLRDAPVGAKPRYTCPSKCRQPSDMVHDVHTCGAIACLITCQMASCTNTCLHRDHMHGLAEGSVHLCGREHDCPSLCDAKGICDIKTQPQSIQATFTGRHEKFDYTKYSQVHQRNPCGVKIPFDQLEHSGAHAHDVNNPFHFCETKCPNCGYYCTLPHGHTQKEHETSHGSMSQTRWAIDGPDGEVVELDGHKFSANDEGAPMLCSMVCLNMGRHVHVDFCRSDKPENCGAEGLEHMKQRIQPQPDKEKDRISHKLYWQRLGFKDPYSRDDQSNFEKCDTMCAGPEHKPDADGKSHPSYCTLPMFHPPHRGPVAAGAGYVSGDGHLFTCRNPVVLHNAFHVIFVIDRSGSMSLSDKLPLANTPSSARIAPVCNNRLGAVYSALYAFWSARATAQASSGQAALRRDAYTVMLFDSQVHILLQNDFQSSPDALLATVLQHRAYGGTNYDRALQHTQVLMEKHWSTDRGPVVIFLSDGECSVSDNRVQEVCKRAIALGDPLSFHTVAFGPANNVLQRMTQIAKEEQTRAPPKPMRPPSIPSSYTTALDSIQLSETFLGIADSLRKTRGSLMRG